MLLTELITHPSQVVIDLKATDRWQAIDELVAVLVEHARLPESEAEAVVAAVRDREQMMSTGIGHGIGIPHAPSEHVDAVQGVLGIARHDVEFDAMDGEPVRLVMLFVVPKDQFQNHLDTLADIARVLSNGDIRKSLRAAASEAEVLDIIRAAGAK